MKVIKNNWFQRWIAGVMPLCLFALLPLSAQVSVAKYYGDRDAAITFTFDDGLQEHYSMVFPRLKQLGLKASFGIIGSKVGSDWKGTPTMTWDQLKEMAADGQEITSHGWAHHAVINLSGEALRYEVQHNDTVIYQHLGFYPRTYFYPGNRKTDEGVAFCSLHRVGTRMQQGSFGSKRDSAWVQRTLDRTLKKKEWTVTMTHGITHGYDAFSNPQLLWDCLQQVAGMQDRLWVATLHDALAYQTERDTIRLDIKQGKNGELNVTPTMPLDKQLFNHPLTLVVNGSVKEATQNGRTLTLTAKNGKTLLDIDPHGGKIKIQTTAAVKQELPRRGDHLVILTAGQSNTDGRVMNDELPQRIQQNKYKLCQWSYGSGEESGNGQFETFWPRMVHPRNPHRWAYDAVVYYEVEQHLKKPFYVIKESLGGTAIDTTCQSTNQMYWSANPDYLSRTAAADKGGKSLLKAFTDNIGACIDQQLSKLKGGYDIRVMMWHQGESDRKAPWRYYDNLKAVVSYVRNYLVQKTGDKSYSQLPIVCGTYSEKSRGYKKEIVDALYRLQQEDPYFHVVDVSDATLREDRIHFDAAGAELLGMRMYNKLLEIGVIK